MRQTGLLQLFVIFFCLQFPSFHSLHSCLIRSVGISGGIHLLQFVAVCLLNAGVFGALRRDALSTLRQGLCGKTMPAEVWRPASGKAKQEPRGNIHLQIPLPKEFKHVTAAKSGKRLGPCSQIKIAGSCQIPDSHCNVSLHVYIMEV